VASGVSGAIKPLSETTSNSQKTPAPLALAQRHIFGRFAPRLTTFARSASRAPFGRPRNAPSDRGRLRQARKRERSSPFQSLPCRLTDRATWVGLKGAAASANPDDTSTRPKGARAASPGSGRCRGFLAGSVHCCDGCCMVTSLSLSSVETTPSPTDSVAHCVRSVIPRVRSSRGGARDSTRQPLVGR